MPPQRRSTNTAGVLAVKKVFVTPNGGWVYEGPYAHIKAWSRMFALFAMALLVMTSLGSKLLLTQGQRAKDLLRRVVSRRRSRCEWACERDGELAATRQNPLW